jgi:hypothetical protein
MAVRILLAILFAAAVLAALADDSFFNLLGALDRNVTVTASPSPDPGDGATAPTDPPASTSPPAVPPTSIAPDPGTTERSTQPGGTPNVSQPAGPTTNVVDIVAMAGAGNQVVVRVNVGAPPAAQLRYILVARFDKPFRYDMKTDVPSTPGPVDLRVDLAAAPSGSWRDFAVLAVTDAQMAMWRPSLTGSSLTEDPGGAVVAPWKPYQRT